MSAAVVLAELELPSLSTVDLSIDGEKLNLSGTITALDPSNELSPFLRKLHDKVVEASAPELCVDVSKLTFVNSSAIRLFIDWAMWVKAEETTRRYRLRFVTSRGVTWQRTSFAALKSLAGDVIEIEVVA